MFAAPAARSVYGNLRKRNSYLWTAPELLLVTLKRFRRDGDTLHYQVTVEDPEVLLEPWVMNPRELTLNRDPRATLRERVPCRDYDEAVAVSRIRH